MTKEIRMRAALQELYDIAIMVENSTDPSHWQRLDRALAAARRLLPERLKSGGDLRDHKEPAKIAALR